MRIHVVQKGETFESIAKKYHISVDELVNMNRHLDYSNDPLPKMKVKVPMVVEEKPSEEPILSVSDKRMAPPHDPNKPKMLPRVKEDEFVISDKVISSIEENQKDEYIQQFLPEGYENWVIPEPYPTQTYDYHYVNQTMAPYPYEQRQYAQPYYNPYGYMNQNPYGYTYNNQYYYRPYNPCGCNGYYY
ncbi:LysM peptidoglycan-binding domain-containing protein [Piscibacillus halophilus]|uniref:LysM peptidoglycan-binding domain-containing protein n=1 Tax=Piscibacillus halophilus TaxID=571933 RepID=UPI00158B9E4D|nr:LysM domain-containing protein [Piscibacillus halophilus]